MRHFLKIAAVLAALTPQLHAQTIDLSKRPTGPDMVMKTFGVELNEDASSVAQSMKSQLGHILEMITVDGAVMASYSGFDTPAPLRDYLLKLLPDLNPEFVGKDVPVSLSIAVMPSDDDSYLQIIMAVPSSENPTVFGASVPHGATIVMDDSNPKDCKGQVVLTHSKGLEDSAETFVSALESEGFTLESPSNASTSFFVGHRQDCALFLYIQPDLRTPDQSMVVVRFTED